MGEMRLWEPFLVVVAIGLCLIPSCVVEEETRDRFDDDDGGGGVTSSSSGLGGSTSTSSGTGGTTSTSSSSTSSSTSSSSSGTACPDPYDEPNDTENTATDLGTISDCDSSGGQAIGVLSGDDEDWYTYYGTDGSCVVDAAVSIVADGQVRVCQYIDCTELTLDCPQDTSPATSPNGRAGCCSELPFELGFNCSGLWEDADVYISIDKPGSFPCVSYTLDYHF